MYDLSHRVEYAMLLLTDSLAKAKEACLPCWIQWFLHRWWSTDCHLLSCFSCCDDIDNTGTFPLGSQMERKSVFRKAPSGWVTLLPFLPLKLWGNLQDEASSMPFLVRLLFLLLSLPTTSWHVPNVGQMCSFCRLLIFLEVVGTADVPVSVFSFSSLQFCYKIGTVLVLLPFRFSKLFTSLFLPQWKLPSSRLWHRCNLLREHVPSFFFQLLLHSQVPFLAAWLLHSLCVCVCVQIFLLLLTQ